MATVRVIGCGNPAAGDDAAGLLAVRAASEELGENPNVEMVEAGPSLRVLDLLDDADGAVVVDAIRSSRGTRSPGEVLRVDVGAEGLPPDLHESLSSHGLGLGEVIGLAGALGSVRRLVFLGVEVADVEMGRPLSPPVAEALPSLVRAIVSDARRMVDAEDPGHREEASS